MLDGDVTARRELLVGAGEVEVEVQVSAPPRIEIGWLLSAEQHRFLGRLLESVLAVGSCFCSTAWLDRRWVRCCLGVVVVHEESDDRGSCSRIR